ncbi:MAG: type II secretion system F family protein [Candidatus Diapherotrites archaeon]|nr:type II secretion system F family protein [Candidatus Diapherotrites archaeon]
MTDYLPPMPMKRDRALKLARNLAFIGYQITRLHPAIIADLAQAEMKWDPEDYSALALLSAAFQGVTIFVLLLVVMYATGNWAFFWGGVGISVFFFFFMFMRSMMYPTFMVRKRVYEIERNFLYALRHLLIQVMGGTPVFNSMVSVSEAGYGEISHEFMRVVQEINSGKSMTKALERMALRNPSIYLRRTIWQVVNALRTGSDMGQTLRVIVEQFTAEQRVLLQKFAKELGPWAMMYMMVTVIFPTLGMTLFLIMSSLSSITLNEGVMLSFVLMSVVVQYFFIQFLKTKRPVMRW